MMHTCFFAIHVAILLPSLLLTSCNPHTGRHELKEDPEIHMNTTELITSKGYPCEEYDIHTKDGYILGTQRIPGGRARRQQYFAPKPVVLLWHGLLSCSACWVENLVNESLGFMLADAGFDVWLGNSRGNTYSKRHEHLTPDQEEFWNFSWDEMAAYDLPATVDKILSVTGAQQVFYVGHSQGCEIAIAELSRDPDFASKIKLFVGLAPATYLGDIKSPLIKLLPYAKELEFLLELFGKGEFLPQSNFLTWLGSEVCTLGEIPLVLCENIMFIIAGYDYDQMNASRIPVYVGQHPAGTSVRNIVHYVQCMTALCLTRPVSISWTHYKQGIIPVYVGQHPAGTSVKNIMYYAQSAQSNLYQMFDYGPVENMKKYNQSSPPQYYPSNITTPIAVYSGTADWLVTPSEMKILLPQIKNLVKSVVIDGWEHLDFIWAMDAPQQCYNEVIHMFKNFS